MKARKDTMYSFFFLLCLFTCSLNAEVNVHQHGISVALTDITNQSGVMLTIPKRDHSIHIRHNEHKHVNIPISKQPIALKGLVKGKAPFTKATIQRLDDQHVVGHFYHTAPPHTHIMPDKTVLFGFRYPALPKVIPGTTRKVGNIDVLFYKQHNAVKVTIDVHGKAHLYIVRTGPWMALFKHTDTDHPHKAFTVKAIHDNKGKLIHTLDHKHHAADINMIDELIMNNVAMADIDCKRSTISLIIK